MSSPAAPFFLAIETSTRVSSVALFAGANRLCLNEHTSEKDHARILTTLIEKTVADAGITMEQLQAVAVGSGPGSYTGLRVGVSTAKGLCMALGLPLYSFGSLVSVAAQLREFAKAHEALIVSLTDARRMEVYCEIYDADLQVVEPVHARIISDGSFAAWNDRRLVFAGDGLPKLKEVFLGEDAMIYRREDVMCSARAVGEILMKKINQNQAEDLVTFEPFYLKNFATTTPKNPLG